LERVVEYALDTYSRFSSSPYDVFVATRGEEHRECVAVFTHATTRDTKVQVLGSDQRLANGTALAESRQVCAQFDAQPLKT
jgi:hypothetical protein